jgi:hypothetical protein
LSGTKPAHRPLSPVRRNPEPFLSTITLAERGEDVTEVTMRALLNTKAQRDDERYGADERGREADGIRRIASEEVNAWAK